MNLGDFLPEEWKSDFTGRNVVVGTVIKLFVKDTNPPKEKRFVVVGNTQDKLLVATVYFNSEINKNVNWAKELVDQHLFFEKDGREYLDKDCFLDCSKLTPKDYEMVAEAVKNKPESVSGTVSDAELAKNRAFEARITVYSAAAVSNRAQVLRKINMEAHKNARNAHQQAKLAHQSVQLWKVECDSLKSVIDSLLNIIECK